MNRLDGLWSRAIVVRDNGTCQKCYKQSENPHHVFYRTKLGSRWLLENGINLCDDCHVHWAHAKPEEFMKWWIEKVGEEMYLYAKEMSLEIKPDLDEVELTLKEGIIKVK